MEFGNPIVGGIRLIRDAIRSQNYTQGTTGWTVNNDGTAEFNSVTIRNGLNVSSTELYYNGTPALGNLIASVSATGGTDQYGNQYPPGVTSYDRTNNIFANMSTGSVQVGTISGGVAQINTAASITSFFPVSSVPSGTVSSPQTATNNAQAQIDLIPGIFNARIGSANVSQIKLTGDPSLGADVLVGVGGVTARLDPNSAGLQSFYKWQTPTYNANWSPSTGFNGITGLDPLNYRLDAEDNIVFQGCFVASATTLPGSAVFNIADTNYRPATQGGVFVMRNHGGTVTSGMALYTTGGNFDLFGQMNMPIALGDEYWVSGTLRLKKMP